MSDTQFDEEASNFVVALGKAMHHYAAVELLLNTLISDLVGDSVFTASFITQSAFKRINLVAKLVERMEPDLKQRAWESGSLFTQTQAAFHNRNKIAHNPYMATQKIAPDGSHIQASGILVVRYSDAGSKQEWVNLASLKQMIGESSALLQRYAELLTHCQVLRAQKTSIAA